MRPAGVVGVIALLLAVAGEVRAQVSIRKPTKDEVAEVEHLLDLAREADGPLREAQGRYLRAYVRRSSAENGLERAESKGREKDARELEGEIPRLVRQEEWAKRQLQIAEDNLAAIRNATIRLVDEAYFHDHSVPFGVEGPLPEPRFDRNEVSAFVVERDGSVRMGNQAFRSPATLANVKAAAIVYRYRLLEHLAASGGEPPTEVEEARWKREIYNWKQARAKFMGDSPEELGKILDLIRMSELDVLRLERTVAMREYAGSLGEYLKQRKAGDGSPDSAVGTPRVVMPNGQVPNLFVPREFPFPRLEDEPDPPPEGEQSSAPLDPEGLFGADMRFFGTGSTTTTCVQFTGSRTDWELREIPTALVLASPTGTFQPQVTLTNPDVLVGTGTNLWAIIRSACGNPHKLAAGLKDRLYPRAIVDLTDPDMRVRWISSPEGVTFTPDAEEDLKILVPELPGLMRTFATADRALFERARIFEPPDLVIGFAERSDFGPAPPGVVVPVPGSRQEWTIEEPRDPGPYEAAWSRTVAGLHPGLPVVSTFVPPTELTDTEGRKILVTEQIAQAVRPEPPRGDFGSAVPLWSGWAGDLWNATRKEPPASPDAPGTEDPATPRQTLEDRLEKQALDADASEEKASSLAKVVTEEIFSTIEVVEARVRENEAAGFDVSIFDATHKGK